MKLKDLTDIIYEIVKNPTDAAAIEEEVRLAIENPQVNTVAQRIAARRRFVAVLRQHKVILGGMSGNESGGNNKKKKSLSRDLPDNKVKVFAQLVDDGLRAEIKSADDIHDAHEKATYAFFLDQMRHEFRSRLEVTLGQSLLPIVIDQAAAEGAGLERPILAKPPVKNEPRYIPKELIAGLKADNTSLTEPAPVVAVVEEPAPIIPVKLIGGVRKAKPVEVEEAERRLRQKGYKV